MKVYAIVLNPASKVKPENYNPLFAILEDKEEAHKIADNLHGYYVLEKIIGELG